MKNKKLLLSLCAALIVAGSVIGTIAYLTASTDVVKNTFVVGKLMDDTSKFILREHVADDADNDGVYTLDPSSETDENSYTVVPEVAIPKDPFVRIDEELKLEAYVFVEVVNKLPEAFTVTVDDSLWTALGMTGSNGGEIYVLKAGTVKAGEKLAATAILKDNEVQVGSDDISLTSGENDTLEFYGYLIQAAGFANAAAAAAGLGFTAVSGN